MFTIDDTPFGPIVGAAASAELTRYLATTDRPYFFAHDTMRWFGTVRVRWYGGIVATGTDNNAPDGYPRHWARVFGADGGAHKLAQGHDRAKVDAWARKASRQILAEDGTFPVDLDGYGGPATVGVDCDEECDH